jgi:hypothetical protein
MEVKDVMNSINGGVSVRLLVLRGKDFFKTLTVAACPQVSKSYLL